jgi:hypothetical protein
MEAARRIRDAVRRVALLRQAALSQPPVGAALGEVKRVQARRFAGTYADLLSHGPYVAASRFFLDELYSDKDYAERDDQFARIAGAIERFFPAPVVETAVALADLHALTEELDEAMAESWARRGAELPLGEAPRYVDAWRDVGRRAERESQLAVVLDIGTRMARLTRTPGLRTLLKMMRGPATAAGLGSLQRFLENGFDTFGAMARQPGGAEEFLATIQRRETALIAMLFDAPVVACETELARTLGQAP